MKWFRFRMRRSIRFWMLLVAIVALSIAIPLVESRRRSEYTARLYYHYQQMEGCPDSKGFFDKLPRASQQYLIRTWVYHAAMSQKYETALSVPLLFVDADPAEPARPTAP